jgi:flagellin
MSSVIYTNTASLVAQKNLLGAQNALATSVERLSSGLRINRARDDAAGLSVANSLQTQINGANQGIRNMNDAISMVQTAEGAIAAASDMGQRILTLATQGANGTLGATEKEAIINEMKKLLDSINSIGSRTTYAGNNLLQSNVSSLAKVAEVATFTPSSTGLAAGESITVAGLTYTSTGTSNAAEVAAAFSGLSDGATDKAGVTTGTFSGQLNGYSTAAGANSSVIFTSSTYGDLVNLTAVTNKQVDADIAVTAVTIPGVAVTTPQIATFTPGTAGLTAGQSITVQGLTYTSTGVTTQAELASAFAGLANGATSGASLKGAYSGKLEGYSSNNVSNGAVTFTASAAGVKPGFAATSVSTGATAAATLVTQEGGPATAFSMQISNSSSDVINLTQDAFVNIGSGDLLAGSHVGGQASALANKVNAPSTGEDFWKDIQTIAGEYVKSLSTQRSSLGAFQNQMEYTLSNITELSANLSASRSRVIDTDYAAETADLTRGQILQQAATAMLAQANQMPNVILTLLK